MGAKKTNVEKAFPPFSQLSIPSNIGHVTYDGSVTLIHNEVFMAGSKRTSTQPKEWAKHLRSFGKKEFWSSVRNRFRSEEKEEMIQEIDVEELKRNKEEYERDLRESLGYEKPTGEPDTRLPYVVAKRIDDGINEQSEMPEGLINGREQLLEYVARAVNNDLARLQKVEEKGIPVGDGFGNVLFHTTMSMPCPEPNQINPISPEEVREIFKDIRGRIGEPGPQSTDDPLFLKRRIPPPVVYLPAIDQIKHNAEYINDIFPDESEKLIPKVITIEVSGEVGVGKSFLLHYIDKVIYERLGVDTICPELEVERNGNNMNEIPGYMLDDFTSGRVIIQLKEKNTKPISFSHDCPCCD